MWGELPRPRGFAASTPGVEAPQPRGARAATSRFPSRSPWVLEEGERVSPKHTEGFFGGAASGFFWHCLWDSCWVVWGELWVMAARRAGAAGTEIGHKANTCKVHFPPQKAELRYLQAA